MKKILWMVGIFVLVLSQHVFAADGENIYGSRSFIHDDTGHQDEIHLHEVGIGGGYGFGDLKSNQGDFEVFPIFLHFGFDINPLVGLEDHEGTLEFALEPFVNPVSDPSGFEAGLDLFLRYSYPVFNHVSLYAEAGAGPMYFAVDTIEQGDKGFNFLDQFGGGLKYYFAKDKAFNLGYRWRHVSNAGLGNDPNTGINAHSFIVGLSSFY